MEAPEPMEIEWLNIEYCKRHIILKRLAVFILTCIILVIGASIIYYLEYVRLKNISNKNLYLNFAFETGISLFFIAFNYTNTVAIKKMCTILTLSRSTDFLVTYA